MPPSPQVMTMSDCIEWQGTKDSAGYGKVYIPGRGHVGAHRLAWEEANGPIPDGLWVLHHCDNRPCVNVEHLFLGTHEDNMRDMAAKGRSANNPVVGEAHVHAKLTEAAVRDIRARAERGESTRSIARRYSVNPSTAQRIIDRKKWAHVAATPAEDEEGRT